MSILEKLRLLLQAKRAVEAIEKEKGMDWRKTLAKMGKDLLHTCAGLAAAAITAYYADPEHLKALLADLPLAVSAAAIPVLSAGLVVLRDWLKHRSDPPR